MNTHTDGQTDGQIDGQIDLKKASAQRANALKKHWTPTKKKQKKYLDRLKKL